LENAAKRHPYNLKYASFGKDVNNAIKRALSLPSESCPEALSKDQWAFVKNMTSAYRDFCKQSPLAGDEVRKAPLAEAMTWWIRSIDHGQIWRTCLTEALMEMGEFVGTPWRWVCAMDLRSKMSMKCVEDFHSITIKLTEQWLATAYNAGLPRQCKGSWLIPHSTQMRAASKKASLEMDRILSPTYTAPPGSGVLDVDIALIEKVQNFVQIDIHNRGWDGRGTCKEDAPDYKLTGDNGHQSNKISTTFAALIPISRRQKLRNAIDGCVSRYSQSTDHILPLVMVMMKETGMLWHQAMDAAFKWKEKVDAYGGKFYHTELKRFYYINIPCCMDMSSIQKCAGKKINVDGVQRVKIKGGVSTITPIKS